MDYDSMSYNPNRQGSYSAPNGGGGGYLADFDPDGPAAPASAQQVRGFLPQLSENREKKPSFFFFYHMQAPPSQGRRSSRPPPVI